MGKLKIDKPIRLIELFAGIGSQAKALKRLGADFKHYRICEFDKYAIKSYNAIHGTDFVTSDITQITAEDLGIVDTDKYTYICCYSFPCQDLSLAGKQKLMAKGSGTRSSLLWEVERLLNECEELPQILLMENVTQVHGKKNKEHFDEWIAFLESKGYKNYWKDLNAKNFGIPQNRNRTFMISVLGDYTYEFPKEFPLKLRLKDMLEDTVDEKFYIKNFDSITPVNKDYSMINGGTIGKMHDVSRRVYSDDGISPTIHTCGGGNTEPKVIAGIGEKKSNGGTQWYQQDRVYDNNIAISVTTGFNPYYKVNEPFIVASRGRNPENPSDRTAGIPLEQRLEPNFSGCTNTLTTVQKDNYVAEPQVLRAERTEYGKAIRKQYESGELYEKIGNMREMKPRTDGVSNTITTVQKDNYICEPMVRKIGNIYHSGGQNGNVYDSVGISPTLLSGETNTKGNGGIGSSNAPKIAEPIVCEQRKDEGLRFFKGDYCGTLRTIDACGDKRVIEPHNLRIRKLTPKECWRLMGFDDADFEKAEAVNSNTQLYKQAGNSIVVDVLEKIFGEML